LDRTDELTILALSEIQMIVNAQHRCRPGGCIDAMHIPRMQEHRPSSRTISKIKHMDDGCFVLNVNALRMYDFMEQFHEIDDIDIGAFCMAVPCPPRKDVPLGTRILM
jgi:hypothetical protein